MARYALRRVLQAVPLLLGITLGIFLLIRLVPGGPLSAYEGNPDVTPQDMARLRQQLGLDAPLPVQYVRWLGHLGRGDLGWSLVTHRPVTSMIAERLGNTAYLMGLALALTFAIALPAGIISARRQYSWFDHAVTTMSFAGFSMPTFWSGLLAILVFSVWLRWLPAGGMYTVGEAFSLGDHLRHLVLPLGILTLFSAARYTRYLRASMLEVLGQDYIATARAKGLGERVVIQKHALKNATIPVVTIVALDLPQLFSGALITETMFSWPGMGRLFWEATLRLDYPVLMAVMTVSATLVVLFNLAADLAYGFLDPRIRYR
ncbi:MAG: diguanylate cyclase [Candidatus Rokubacteria bacterium GWF2_70_14]|nr:MAG: diguanylate cyclase [Candidatus Rokubacteria bacterium GWF2_70_14]